MIYITAILAYLLFLVGIGIYKSKQVKTQADFAVAGRSLSPWVMVCTMLAVWIGTGSIVGNAGQAYRDGMAALFIPLGSFIGMILLSQIATKARNYEVYTVPEIISDRYGPVARMLAVLALIMAYMVIVGYQFNAGGMVLEVIAGKKAPVPTEVGTELTKHDVGQGYLVYEPDPNWIGTTTLGFQVKQAETWSDELHSYTIDVVAADQLIEAVKQLTDQKATNHIAIKQNSTARITITGHGADADKRSKLYQVARVPSNGSLFLSQPKLSAGTATVIAAIFIITYTMLAGLLSLAFADVVTGTVITLSLIIAFPVLLAKAGGFAGMEQAFIAMGDRPQHMQFWNVYTPVTLINFCLPVFLLVLGDANQYQRIFASRNAKGAKTAVTIMIFLALGIELLIIAEAWIASSLIPDPNNGRYVLIYAAKHFMPLPLGILFLVTVVGIIISTADSFLLVPATTFIKDVYQVYINPKADERRIVMLSRLLVLIFGVIAYMVSLAFAESTTVFRKALYAFTIYGAAITPCLVAALFWKRATPAGAVTSILSGTIVALVWEELAIIKDNLPGNLSDLDAVLPAMTVSVLSLVGVSLLTGNPKPQD